MKQLLLIIPLLGMLCIGCTQKDKEKPEKITIKSGNNQCGAPEAELKKQLEVTVFGPVRKGLLGGKGKQHGIEGIKVYFESQNSSIKLSQTEVTTDHGGRAAVTATLGKKNGDNYVTAYFVKKDKSKKKVVFRLVTGVLQSGNKQEGKAGSELSQHLQVKLLDEQQKPMVGAKVYFKISGAANGAKISPEITTTDDKGEARAKFKLGKKTGQYYATAEIVDEKNGVHIRGIEFKAMAVNQNILLMGLLGGLAIFIFGMRMMSANLQLVAGDRLKSALQLFTKNRFVAILAGTVVTGLIQSSSACTVMTVGFVNAGLLTLKQAVGVVMGANIGTTLTAQIISFKLNNLTLPSIAVGLLMTMLCKKKLNKYWGQVLIGFGFLFLGMTTMGGVLKPLKNSPSFIAFFNGFDCTPVNGVMPFANVMWAIFIGTIMTIAIQSSSATIGLALALAGSGLLNFYTAVPLILGDNIGTTSTAIIASIGTNRTSRRTALVHFLFNMIGVLYMVLLFYVPFRGQPIFLSLVDTVTSGDIFVNGENVERHIAMAHTLFNVFNVIIFLPFVGLLSFLAQKIIKDSKEEEDDDEQVSYLESRLLQTPSIAIEQVLNEISFMAKVAWKNTRDTFACLMNDSLKQVDKILRREAMIDDLQDRITHYLADLSMQQMTEEESQLMPDLIHMVNDVERAGDLAKNVLESAERRQEKEIEFSPMAISELSKMYELVEKQYQSLASAFKERNIENAKLVREHEKKINSLEKTITQNHIKRLEKKECSVKAGILFLQIIGNYEKIGDRFNNVAERLERILPNYQERLKKAKPNS